MPGLCQGCAGGFGTCLSPNSRANVHAGTGAAPGTAAGSRAPSPPRMQAMDLEVRRRRRRREGSEEAESSQKYSVLYFILQTERTRCWEAPRRAHAGGGMGGTRCRAHTRVEMFKGLPSPTGTPTGAPPAQPGAALPHSSTEGPGSAPAPAAGAQLCPSPAVNCPRGSFRSVLGVRDTGWGLP